MSLLADLLTQFPACRITITGGSRHSKRKAAAGDRRYTKRWGWQVRQQQRYQGMYCVRRGRPVYEWVREEPQATPPSL